MVFNSKKAQISEGMKIMISIILVVILIIFGFIIWRKGIMGVLGGG